MSSTHTLPVNIFSLEGGEIMLARDNENFRTPGENWTHDPPVEYYMFIARSNYWTGGSRVWFLPRAWKFPLSRASMVSPPSKLKMFTGNLCVLLTSVLLKLSFRSPAEKKKQTGTNKQTLFGNYINAINRPGFWCFSHKWFSSLINKQIYTF